MATKQRVDIDVVVKNTQRIDRLEKALGKTSKSATGLSRAAKFAAGAIAAIGVGSAVRSLIRVGSQVENLGLRFKFLFGSAEEGAKAFDTLTQFASKVPFSLEQISAASGNLAVVAKDANELNDILEITGNVAAVSGLDFQTAGEQIQRAFAGGIASADIFRERGVRSLLGFKEGATVTAEETRAAFFRVFGKGGQFGAATDEFANTLDGTISMLQDKLFKFQDVASREFFDELKGQLGDLNQFFEDNQETIDRYAKELGQALGTAVINTGKAIVFLKDNIDAVKIAFGALVALKLAMVFTGIARSLKVLGGALALTGKLARKHPLILIAMGATIAGLYVFRDQLDEITEKLFGTAEASEAHLKTLNDMELAYDDMGTQVDESIRQKNLEAAVISGVNGVYDDYHTEIDIAANKLKHKNQVMEQSIPLYEKMEGANKNFVKSMLELGETETQRINRQEQERLKRLDQIYKKDQRNTQEYQEAKTKITADAERQRLEIEKSAAKQRQDTFDKAIEAIRQGKLEEVKLEEVTSEQRKQITFEAGKSILANSATFSRKAFEAYKAVQIAEAIIGAKSAIVSSFAAGSKIGGPILGAVFAAAAGAATLAQINAIRSQQYPGREMGGPVKKGQTYTVGESGVELFTPSSNGQIIPNHELGGRNEITINFNVEATDAASFDSMLVERRDTIVGVINEALNETGRRPLV